jgi:hypothetical protein
VRTDLCMPLIYPLISRSNFACCLSKNQFHCIFKSSWYFTMPPHSTAPASGPFAPSVWLAHSVSLLHARVRHSSEIPGYQENQPLPMSRMVNNLSTPTSSTNSTDHPPLPSPLDRPRSPRHFRKIVRNPSRCPTGRTPKRMIMQSKAGWIVSGGLLARQLPTHLCSYVGQGGSSDPSHAVDTSIPRSCRFHLFLYRNR